VKLESQTTAISLGLRLNPKTEEASNSQEPKPAKGHSQKKSDNKKSKPPDTIRTRIEGDNIEGQVRGILFCPKCGSTDVFWAFGLPNFGPFGIAETADITEPS
jgi:hypothetical protein